jgi:hypothetical protein
MLPAALREGMGVAIATSAYGISFGALAVASGLDVWQTCVLSLVMFTGGSQFAFIGVIGAGDGGGTRGHRLGGPAGVRNVAYGLRMPRSSARAGSRCARSARHDRRVDRGGPRAHRAARAASASGHGRRHLLGWNLTTLLGALLGDVLGDPRLRAGCRSGAAFLALLWPAAPPGDRRRRRRRRRDRAHAGAHAGDPVLIAASSPSSSVGSPGWVDAAPGAGSGRRSRARRPAVMWTAVLAASLLHGAEGARLLIPARWFDAPAVAHRRSADGGAAGALVAVQTLGVGQIVVDARVPALIVALRACSPRPSSSSWSRRRSSRRCCGVGTRRLSRRLTGFSWTRALGVALVIGTVYGVAGTIGQPPSGAPCSDS